MLALELWHSLFGHVSHEALSLAFRRAMLECRWEPKPADIMQALYRILIPEDRLPLPAQAFEMACNSKDKLPPLVRDTKKLFSYSELSDAKSRQTVRAQFIHAYEQLRDQRLADYFTPVAVQRTVERVRLGFAPPKINHELLEENC